MCAATLLCFWGGFCRQKDPQGGCLAIQKEGGGKLHAPRLFSNTRSVLDSLIGAGPSKGYITPCSSPEPSQNDLEGGHPRAILANALKLIFQKSHPLTLPKHPTTQPRPMRQLFMVHMGACAGGGDEKALLARSVWPSECECSGCVLKACIGGCGEMRARVP